METIPSSKGGNILKRPQEEPQRRDRHALYMHVNRRQVYRTEQQNHRVYKFYWHKFWYKYIIYEICMKNVVQAFHTIPHHHDDLEEDRL